MTMSRTRLRWSLDLLEFALGFLLTELVLLNSCRLQNRAAFFRLIEEDGFPLPWESYVKLIPVQS